MAEPPAQPGQHAVAQPHPVAAGGAGGVAGTVAFDAEREIGPLPFAQHAQIDPAAGVADPPLYSETVLFQKLRDGFHKTVVLFRHRRAGQRDFAVAFGVLQEVFQMGRAGGPGSAEVYVGVADRTYHQHLFAGAGDRDVQPPFAALPVQRAEVHRELPLPVAGVADRKDDHVALIALHVFQILHENRLRGRIVEAAVELRMAAPFGVDQVLDQLLLRHTERDHANGAAAVPLQPFEHLAHHAFGFGAVAAAPATFVDPVRHEAELHAEVAAAPRRRKGEQPVFVVMAVAESDQRLVAAAVVPVQISGVETGGDALVEDAFRLLARLVLVAELPLRLLPLEEAGRRHLLRVAHHDQLAAPRDRADRIPHRNLRSLVEYDQIELRQLRRQVLRHRQRAHQETRLQQRQQVRDLAEQRPHRLVAGALLAFALEQPQFAPFRARPLPAAR